MRRPKSGEKGRRKAHGQGTSLQLCEEQGFKNRRDPGRRIGLVARCLKPREGLKTIEDVC